MKVCLSSLVGIKDMLPCFFLTGSCLGGDSDGISNFLVWDGNCMSLELLVISNQQMEIISRCLLLGVESWQMLPTAPAH